MSFTSFIQTLPKKLCQPGVIAAFASVGIHGLLAISLPQLSAYSKPEEQKTRGTVAVVELTSAEQTRVPALTTAPQTIPYGTQPLSALPPPPLSLLPSASNFYPNNQSSLSKRTDDGKPSRTTRRPGGSRGVRQDSGQNSAEYRLIPLTPPQEVHKPGEVQPSKENNDTQRPTGFPGGLDGNNFDPPSDDKPEAQGKTEATETQGTSGNPSETQGKTDGTPDNEGQSQETASNPQYAYNSAGTSDGEAAGKLGIWMEENITKKGYSDVNSNDIVRITINYPVNVEQCLDQAKPATAVALVDPDGKILGSDVIQSTGYSILNETAQKEVAKKIREKGKTGKRELYWYEIKFNDTKKSCTPVSGVLDQG